MVFDFFFVQNNKTLSTIYFNSSNIFGCDIDVLKWLKSKFILLILNHLNSKISGPDITKSFDLTNIACITILKLW